MVPPLTKQVKVVGDVIRFGVRGNGGTYFGDAIVSIASTISLTIGSTTGLSGAK